MKKYSVHIIWGIIAIVVLVGGFFWGKASAGTGARTAFTGTGVYGTSTRRFGAAGGTGATGGFTTGQIASIGTDSFTLQLANGNSEVVLYSTSTAVTEPTTVPVSTLTVGANVMVAGTSNSDGSLTAQTIQVRTGNSAPSGNAQ